MFINLFAMHHDGRVHNNLIFNWLPLAILLKIKVKKGQYIMHSKTQLNMNINLFNQEHN